jgi:hypothetical protein
VNEAIIFAVKQTAADRFEAEAPVEAVRVGVAVKWINDDRDHRGIREAGVDDGAHHQRAIAFVAIRRVADPNIDGAQVRLDVAPVMRRLAVWIDHLKRADGAAVQFSDVIARHIGIGGDLV